VRAAPPAGVALAAVRVMVAAMKDQQTNAPLQFLILLVAGFLQRRQRMAIDYLLAENRVLRARLGPTRLRFTDTERRMLAQKGRPVGQKLLEEIATLASPETILRWYRQLVAAKYDGSACSSKGDRGRRKDATTQLVTMARENPGWGYTRLRGALENLGFKVGRSTIARILRESGIEPAPRRRTMDWKTFLAVHWEAIAAADFFSVEVVTCRGLARYFVLFVLRLKTRQVYIAGISQSLDGAWMAQIARNLTDAKDGFLKDVRHLIVDRDPLYTEQFKTILGSGAVELLKLPPSSPNLNAFAERWVRSIKEECLDRVVPLGQRHLRHLISEYVEHFHAERNHQGLANLIPFPETTPANDGGRIEPRERLGGLLSYYHRKVA
jgi:putative transposase